MMQVKLEKTNYKPTLMANVNIQTSAQRQQWDFFDPGGAWYASSVFGVSLKCLFGRAVKGKPK